MCTHCFGWYLHFVTDCIAVIHCKDMVGGIIAIVNTWITQMQPRSYISSPASGHFLNAVCGLTDCHVFDNDQKWGWHTSWKKLLTRRLIQALTCIIAPPLTEMSSIKLTSNRYLLTWRCMKMYLTTNCSRQSKAMHACVYCKILCTSCCA